MSEDDDFGFMVYGASPRVSDLKKAREVCVTITVEEQGEGVTRFDCRNIYLTTDADVNTVADWFVPVVWSRIRVVDVGLKEQEAASE